MFDRDYPETANCAQGLSKIEYSVRAEIEERRKRSYEETKKLDRALELLDKNPDIEELMTLLGRRY